MARKATDKAVTAKMYRHFAVVTLCSTAALALATGEGNADSLNSTLNDQQAQVKASGKKIQSEAQPTVVKRIDKANRAAAAPSAGWGSDNSGEVSGGGGGFAPTYMPPVYASRKKPIPVDRLNQLNLTPEQLMAMSPEEQAKVMQELNPGQPMKVSPEVQAQRQQEVVASSLSRSGFDGPCNDC